MQSFRLTPEERRALGDRLRAARYLAKLTISAVAEHFGVSTNTVQNWEHGGLPSDDLRPRIADLYGVDEVVLFAEHEDRVTAAKALIGQ